MVELNIHILQYTLTVCIYELPFEDIQIPTSLCIQPIHLHPWLDDTDSNPDAKTSLTTHGYKNEVQKWMGGEGGRERERVT